MKKLFILISLFYVMIASAEYKTASQILSMQNLDAPVPVALISSAQDLTASWKDFGSEVSSGGYNVFGLWTDLDINDSVNARIRLLASHTTGGATYLIPIRTVAASSVSVEGEYIEFNVDEDQQMLLSWDLDRLVPYIQIQVQVGTVNTTAAQIDSASYTLRWN